jgi:hypothetical protein
MYYHIHSSNIHLRIGQHDQRHQIKQLKLAQVKLIASDGFPDRLLASIWFAKDYVSHILNIYAVLMIIYVIVPSCEHIGLMQSLQNTDIQCVLVKLKSKAERNNEIVLTREDLMVLIDRYKATTSMVFM